jgi:hypothetical protein
MSVNAVLPPMTVGASTAIVKKKPCAPCAAAAAAIASTIPEAEGGTLKVAGRPTLAGAANDDLITVQAFLQSLTGGTAPAAPALAQAQAAADDLSVALAVQQALPASSPGLVTMRTTSIALMVAGALVAGVGVSYLLANPRRR